MYAELSGTVEINDSFEFFIAFQTLTLHVWLASIALILSLEPNIQPQYLLIFCGSMPTEIIF